VLGVQEKDVVNSEPHESSAHGFQADLRTEMSWLRSIHDIQYCLSNIRYQKITWALGGPRPLGHVTLAHERVQSSVRDVLN